MFSLRRVLIFLMLVTPVWAARPGDDAARERRRSPIVEVVERSRDAVVNISTTRIVHIRTLGLESPFDDIFEFGPRMRDQEVQSVGSGVVVHESGYIVTNAHVVAQASDVRVTFADGKTETADIVAVDGEHDLAVLKVATDHPLPYQKLGRSDDLMVGETVVAIGNPMGLQHTATAGIISALDRDLKFSHATYRGLIQTDASINPGNSGGPLINVNDELIGINTAIRGDAQNIGFAIPVNRLWELLPVMLDLERRQRVKFGMRVSGPDANVLTVRPDSPAAKAGLKVGDHVVRFNGKAIRDGIDYCVRLLNEKPGSEVKLVVKRGDQLVDATVPLEVIPPPNGEKLALRLLGIKLVAVPSKVRRAYELPARVGLMVDEIERGSPADVAGMRPGDLILGLDRVTTESLNDVGLALEQVTPGERVLVEGMRLQSDGAWIWPPVSIRTRR